MAEERGDVMGDYRAHWRASTAGSLRDVTEIAHTEADAQEYRDAGWTVEGPFVPAEQLRGAVGALRELVETEERARRIEFLDSDDVQRWEHAITAARALVGGR